MSQELQTIEDQTAEISSETQLQAQPMPNGVSPLVQMLASGQLQAENVQQALDLQKQYDKHEAEKAYHAAMAVFRSQVSNVVNDSKGHNSTYASLGAVTRAVTPALTANGFNFKWTDEQDHANSTITVTCHVTHAQGHSEKTSLTSNYETSGNKNDIQAIASAKSYLNRYTLSGLLGLATEDDDGRGAHSEPVPLLSENQESQILDLLSEIENHSDGHRKKWLAHYENIYGSTDTPFGLAMPASDFAKCVASLKNRLKEVQAKSE